MAPHHPLLAGLEHGPNDNSSGYLTGTGSSLTGTDYPRHRHLHHRSSAGHAHASGPGGHAPPSHTASSYSQATTSSRMPQAMPLNTFGGSGSDIMTTPSEQRENERESLFGTRIDFNLGSKSAPVTSGNSPTQSINVRSPANDHLRLTAKYEKIDRIATWLFPIIFLLFNVIYWSYYLLLSDALQEIW